MLTFVEKQNGADFFKHGIVLTYYIVPIVALAFRLMCNLSNFLLAAWT